MANSRLTIIPKLAKLSPSVISILGLNPSPMTLRGTNTYIIGKGKRRILLDTGDGQQPEYFLNLKKSLDDNCITIRDVILSHWHYDHVGGIAEVLKSTEVSNGLEKKNIKLYFISKITLLPLLEYISRKVRSV